MSYDRCLLSDIWCQVSFIRHLMTGSVIRNLMSGVCYQKSDVRCLLSDVSYQTSDGRCLLSDVWWQVSDIRCLMSDVRFLLSDIWCQVSVIRRLMSDLWWQVSDIRCLLSDVLCQVSDFRHLMSDVWFQVADIRRLMSGFCYRTSDFRCLMTDVWYQMSDFRCLISGFFTQWHKLCSLRQSFLHFHFISAVHIWFISNIINKKYYYTNKCKKTNDDLFHLTYGKCMQLCALKCINQMNDTSTCRQQDHFTIWTKFHTCPLNVRVILNMESWKWTLWK